MWGRRINTARVIRHASRLSKEIPVLYRLHHARSRGLRSRDSALPAKARLLEGTRKMTANNTAESDALQSALLRRASYSASRRER